MLELKGPLDVEQAFLTKIAAGGKILPAIDTGVTGDWFLHAHTRRAWEVQVEHYEQYGKPASIEIYNEVHALGVQPVFAPETSLETLVEMLRNSRVMAQLKRSSMRLIETADSGQPVGKLWSDLVTGVTDPIVLQLLDKTGQGTTLQAGWGRFLDNLDKFEEHQGIIGTPWPWASPNVATGGLSPGDYVPILGYRKAGKTDVGVEVAVTAAKDCGERVLVITNELSVDDMLNRCCCRWAEIDYGKFRHGGLDAEKKSAVRAAREKVSRYEAFGIEPLTTHGLAAVSQVSALIDRFKPGIVLWDGHQLSAKSDNWEDVYQLSRRTRALALGRDVGMVVTAQLNPKRTEASYKAYHQDATAVIAIEREGSWIHCTMPEVREGYGAKWSMQCRRGLPLIETPYQQGSDVEDPKGEIVLGEDE